MTAYVIDVQLNVSGAQKKAKDLGDQFDGMAKSIAALGIGALIKETVELGDNYTVLSNKIQAVTANQYELNDVMGKTFAMAQENRVSWEGLVNTYTRISRATAELGISQNETLKITDTISKALKLGGSTTQETASVMLNLSHAFDEGRLHGRQLNSVMMESREIAKIIATQMGVTTDKLRELGKSGAITGDVLARAFLNAHDSISARFGKAIPTVAERVVTLKNAAEKMIGEWNKGVGVFGAIGDALTFITNHLDVLASTIMTVTVPAIIALTVAWAASPLGMVSVVAGAAIAGALALSDALSDVTKEEEKAGKAAYDATIDQQGYMVAQVAAAKAMEDYRKQHMFFNEAVKALHVSVFQLTSAWVQNAAALRRVQESIANTAAMIQVAKIQAATGGEGYEGAVERILKTTQKIDRDNAKVQRQLESRAAWWYGVKKAAQDADEAQQKASEAPIPRATSNADFGIRGSDAEFGTSAELARRAKVEKDFQEFSNTFLKAKKNKQKKEYKEGDFNHDNFIDDIEGFKKGLQDLAKMASETGQLVEQALVNAFQASEDALAHFIRTGEFNFKEFTDHILDDLARILARQLLLSAIGGASGYGWSAQAGAAALGAAAGGFANGGSFTVGGHGGTDNNLVMFRASRNEQVTIQKPQPGSTVPPPSSGGVTIINQFDPRDMTAMLSTPQGQRVVNESIRLSGGYKRVMR